jgi:glutaryl-CoA dehydrogenase
MRTTARRANPAGSAGGDWVLNGSKQWITNGTLADVAVVWARTDEGIRGFLVEKGTAGFTAADQHGKFSLRASTTSELGFHDCRIPGDAILPGTTGLKNALMCLNQARYGIAWGGIGSAMECYHTALEYAKQRVQWNGQPIACHQLVQEKLVWMVSEIAKGQLLCLQLGRLKDAGRLRPHHVSLGKRNNVWVARECAKLAREVLGANGIVDDYPVIRHMLNIESVYTYEGTHDIHGLILGQAITGIPAFNAPALTDEPVAAARPPRPAAPAGPQPAGEKVAATADAGSPPAAIAGGGR